MTPECNAVMVDLETMSTKTNAALVAIGAVKFWLNTKQDNIPSSQQFYARIDLASSQDAGLDIDAETVKWWLQQEKGAQKEVSTDGRDLRDALAEFGCWVPKDAYLFGNGSTFDNVILQLAFKAAGVFYPLTYRQDMCYRTLNRMSDVEPPLFKGVKHHALDDAIYQTLHLMAILEKTPWHHR